MSSQKIKYSKSTDNVYQDLGFVDSEERLTKAKLAMRIEEIIKKKKLKQIEAAKLLSIDQSDILALMSGRLGGFSMEQLIRYFYFIDQYGIQWECEEGHSDIGNKLEETGN